MPSWLAKGKFYLPSMQHCLNGGMAWPIFTTAIAYLWRDARNGDAICCNRVFIWWIFGLSSIFCHPCYWQHYEYDTLLFSKTTKDVAHTMYYLSFFFFFLFKITNFYSNCMLMYKLPCMLRKEKVVVCICDLLIFVNK